MTVTSKLKSDSELESGLHMLFDGDCKHDPIDATCVENPLGVWSWNCTAKQSWNLAKLISYVQKYIENVIMCTTNTDGS